MRGAAAPAHGRRARRDPNLRSSEADRFGLVRGGRGEGGVWVGAVGSGRGGGGGGQPEGRTFGCGCGGGSTSFRAGGRAGGRVEI